MILPYHCAPHAASWWVLLFQPFLRFYWNLPIQVSYEPPEDVSTLLEILPSAEAPHPLPRRVEQFQLFLRFYTYRDGDRIIMAVLAAPFQPFLRFYGGGTLTLPLGNKAVVSTLLEILQTFNTDVDDATRCWVSTLLEILQGTWLRAAAEERLYCFNPS